MGFWDYMGAAFDPNAADTSALGYTGDAGVAFGQKSQAAFQGNDQANIDALRQQLNRQSTGSPIATEQLRQGLATNIAQQQAQAASASPQNQAMATRIAMNNTAKLGYGMSGQASMAGLQQQQMAQQQLAQLALQQRQQDLGGAQTGYQTAVQGYGQAAQNQPKGIGQSVAGLISMAASDKRLKKDIESGDDAASRLLAGLKTYTFRYKDDRYGKGSQLGVMAQEMERVGLKHAVVDTPRGKMVDGAKTATSALALTAALARRVSKLEAR